MTSRQPGTEPPGARLTSRGWLVRVVPVVLLVLLALAGLRGAITAPHWNGPLKSSGLVINGLLIAVLLALLVITRTRQRAARARPEPETGIAPKLRSVLIGALSLGIAGAVVIMLYALHVHLFGKPRLPPPRPRAGATRPTVPVPSARASATGSFSLPLNDILYGLLVLALIAAVVLSVRWSARLRPPVRLGDEVGEEEDSDDLRDAVETGRSALRTLDDARAAIIACYLAMERRLAQRGAERAVADTPDELLARATRNKIVRGTAAARLTALFYEARFSSHPMDQAQRQAAEQALDELAAALVAHPEPMAAGT